MKPQPPLLLASGSPRRLRLLREWGFDPRPVTPGEERCAGAAGPEEEALARARAKGLGARLEDARGLVLAADTLGVDAAGTVLGKPANEAAAETMLRTLSGATHRVITAVWARPHHDRWGVGGVETSLVTFRSLAGSEIQDYVAGGEWRGKAGGYALQGSAAAFVADLRGSRENVVGLPRELTLWALEQAGALWRPVNS